MFKRVVPLISRCCKTLVTQKNCKNSCYFNGQNFQLKKQIYLELPYLENVNSLIISRTYAKGKNIKKNKSKKAHIDENELREFFDIEKLYRDLNKPVDYFKEELIAHTSLRSSIGGIENIKIQFEGETYTIQDLAEIARKNPKQIILDLSSFPQTIPTVMKALQKCDLNLNVQQEGTRVFVPLPKVTKEHRELLAKKAKVYFIKCKEKVREVQIKYIRSLRNFEKLSEDMKHSVIDQLNALGDKHILLAEELLKTKQDELKMDLNETN